MNLRSIATLFTGSLFLFSFFYAVFVVSMPFMPGFIELSQFFSTLIHDQLPSDPWSYAIPNFFCFFGISSLIGAISLVLWILEVRGKKDQAVKRQEYELWSERALHWWVSQILKVIVRESELAIILRGAEDIHPYLRSEDRHWIERCLEKSGYPILSKSPGSIKEIKSKNPGIRISTCIAIGLLATLAILAALAGVITTVYLARLDELPVIVFSLFPGRSGDEALPRIPLNGAVPFVPMYLDFVFALTCAFIAWGLYRLELMDRKAVREQCLSVQGRLEKLFDEFLINIEELLAEKQWQQVRDPAHRLASGLAVATLEMLDQGQRRQLMGRLYALNLLGHRNPLDLRTADLRGSKLDGVQWSGICLRGAVLEGSSLLGASMDHAVLDDANLTGARLQGASLRKAYARRAILRDALCHRTILRFADLRGADFTGANLWQADLRSCDLLGARIDNEQLAVCSGCEVPKADAVETEP